MVGGWKGGLAGDYRIESEHPPREIDKQTPSAILLHRARHARAPIEGSAWAPPAGERLRIAVRFPIDLKGGIRVRANIPYAPFRPRDTRGHLCRILPDPVRAGACRRRLGADSIVSEHAQESAPDRPLPRLGDHLSRRIGESVLFVRARLDARQYARRLRRRRAAFVRRRGA